MSTDDHLAQLRASLRAGQHDSADLMAAWIAVDDLLLMRRQIRELHLALWRSIADVPLARLRGDGAIDDGYREALLWVNEQLRQLGLTPDPGTLDKPDSD